MGFGVTSTRLHKETNSDTIASPSSSTSVAAAASSSTQSALLSPPKRDASIWFPFSLDQSDLTKAAVTNNTTISHILNSNSTSGGNANVRHYESDDRSAMSSTSKSLQPSASAMPSCRYYPSGVATDKSDIFSAYGSSIVSDAVSSHRSLHHITSNSPYNHHTSHVHQYQQQQPGSAQTSHAQAHHSPVSSYSLLQNMSYEAAAVAAAGNARCALPSPTIFPPTPPPSAPWNPWAGF